MKSQLWNSKKIVITGGTSGLGKQLAIQFSKTGAKVVVIARRIELLQKLKREYPKIDVIQGDISSKQETYRLAAEIISKLNKVDLLINNASYLGYTPLRLLLDTECEDFEIVLQTNLIGPFRLTKVILANMVLNNEGVVVNISSDAAISSYPTWGSYSVSKSAFDHLTKIWQKEVEGTGVKFYALDPGDMFTPMHLDADPSAKEENLLDPKNVAVDMIKFLEVGHKYNVVRWSAEEWRKVL
jgi:short-subunit dehydrogenase